jgi:ElaB/YqjD/DUF883 family membrane-anchored ribosome-binding protein
METTDRSTNNATPAMRGNGDGTLHKASSTAHAAVDSVAAAAQGAVGKAKPAIDHVAAMAHQGVDRVATTAGPAADWLADQGTTLMAAQKKVVDDTASYVSANPIKSIGMALATGFLLGRIFR